MKMMRIKMLFFLVIITGMLSACGQGEYKDLQNYVDDLKKHTKYEHVNKSLAELPHLLQVIYHESIRSPFEVAALISRQTKSTNPLNVYDLNTLRFVGTIAQGKKIWAVILAPDNKDYQVTIGDTIGNNYGKITHITSDKLELIETFSENGKPPTQRAVTLNLKEEH